MLSHPLSSHHPVLYSKPSSHVAIHWHSGCFPPIPKHSQLNHTLTARRSTLLRHARVTAITNASSEITSAPTQRSNTCADGAGERLPTGLALVPTSHRGSIRCLCRATSWRCHGILTQERGLGLSCAWGPVRMSAAGTSGRCTGGLRQSRFWHRRHRRGMRGHGTERSGSPWAQ